MLKLDLNALFTPELIAAFQRQWSAAPDAALAQAREAIRLLVAPRDKFEGAIADLVLGLVGPEPDAMAWLEAMAVGSFKLRDSVTYVLSRANESPSKAIRRQQDRIADLAGHARAGEQEAEYRNAYTDALRLIVASSLLTQMRKGVAAKAALGAGWPVMVGVTETLLAEEKRKLFWFGSDPNLQQALALAVREVLAQYRADCLDEILPRHADYHRQLPPGADPYAFFARRSEAFHAELGADARQKMMPLPPAFVRHAATREEHQRAEWRASLLVSTLTTGNGRSAFALAIRAEHRRISRAKWTAGDKDAPCPDHLSVQQAIWDHVAQGGLFPPDLPVAFVHYLEEDVCWFYHQHGMAWVGYEPWRKMGYLPFIPDPTKVDSLNFDEL